MTSEMVMRGVCEGAVRDPGKIIWNLRRRARKGGATQDG